MNNSNIKLNCLLLAVGGCESGSLNLLPLKSIAVTKYHRTKFFIVKLTVGVNVIFLEEGLHLLGRVVETDFLNGAHEIDEGHCAFVENVKVLKHLHEAGLLGQLVRRLLQKLKFKLVFKPKLRKRAINFHIKIMVSDPRQSKLTYFFLNALLGAGVPNCD